MYLKTFTTIAILIVNSSTAQQSINPMQKHDWEDSRYTVNGNSTVTDIKTNLTWRQCLHGLSGLDCSSGNSISNTWETALTIANNSEFAGFNDWRIPNNKECRSLVAYDRSLPAINIAIFPNNNNFFWCSSPDANNSDYAYSVTSNDGSLVPFFRTLNKNIRMVRGGQ